MSAAPATRVEQPCDLCGGLEPAFVLEENGFRICRCRQCSLTYVHPQPARELGEDVGHFDASDWSKSAEETARQSEEIWDDGLVQLERQAGHRGRLLDVGCGHGHFLERARKGGWDPYGIDVSAPALGYARDSLGLSQLEQCDFLQADYPENHFDAVTLWNSLEHVPSPAATLSQALRVLRPGGALMVRVPNMDFSRLVWGFRPLIRLMGLEWSYLMTPPPQHLYGFDPRTLRRLLEKRGFLFGGVVPAGVKVGHYKRMNWRLGLAASVSANVTEGLHRISGGRVNLAATLYAFGTKPTA